MSSEKKAENAPRYFMRDEELPSGFSYPQEYLDFIELNKPSPIAMVGMPPWVFANDFAWAKDQSKQHFGVVLVPFAQAQMEDMVAYFEASTSGEVRVWVANPWDPFYGGRKIFNSFMDWLDFARKTSQEKLEEVPGLADDPFWFPEYFRKIQ